MCFTVKDQSDLSVLNIFCILLSVSQSETLIFLPSLFVSFKLQKKGDFQTRREHPSIPCSAAFDLRKGRGCCSYNPGQGLIDQVSRQMVLVTCKQEFYYGSLLKPWSRCVAEDGLPTFFSCFFSFSFQKSKLALVFFFRTKAWKCFLFLCLFYILKKKKSIACVLKRNMKVTFHVFFSWRTACICQRCGAVEYWREKRIFR